MKRVNWRRKVLPLGLLLCLALAGTAHAGQRFSAQGLEIDVDGSPSEATGFYVGAKVRLTNTGEEKDITLTLRPDYCNAWPGGRLSAARSVRLGKGETAEVYLPLISRLNRWGGHWGGHLAMDVNGSELSINGTPFRCPVSFSRQHNVQAQWLIVADTAPDMRVFDLNPSKTPHVSPKTAWHYLSPRALPRDWLALTTYNAVVLPYDVLARLDPAVREGLATYVRCGGNVLIHEIGERAPDEICKALVGDGAAPLHPAESLPHYFGRIHFRGRINMVKQGVFPGTEDQWNMLRAAMNQWNELTYGPWHFAGEAMPPGFNQASYPRVEGNDILPIEGIGRRPVYLYATVAVIFTALIGPVNYLVLRRKRRLPLMVFTVPVLAALTTGALVFFSIFSEGLGIKGRISSITQIDQRLSKAVTTAKITYYAGLPPRGGLRFSANTLVRPTREWSYRDNSDSAIDWTDGQRLIGAWLPARTQTSFVTIESRTERRRLKLKENPDGTLTVANGLGVALKGVTLLSGDGRRFRIEQLGVEDSKTLQPEGQQAPSLPARPRTTYTYTAEALSSALVERGVRSMSERGSMHYVIGYGEAM